MATNGPALEVNEETYESVATIAELVGHRTTREPYHGPCRKCASTQVDDESKCNSGVDYSHGHSLPSFLSHFISFPNSLASIRFE